MSNTKLNDDGLRQEIFDLYRQYLSNRDFNVIDDGKNYEQLFLGGIEALISRQKEEAQLSRFEYVDWEVGDDNKLRLGDSINCNHQRPHDGYEQNFEGIIVEHHQNKMPVILFEDEFISIENLWLGGWEFSRIKALKSTSEGEQGK